MTTAILKSLLPGALALICISTAVAQVQTEEIRTSAEYRPSGPQAPDTAAAVVLAEARKRVLQQVLGRLVNVPEVKTTPLKPGQLEALVPVIVSIETETTGVENAPGGSVYRASVLVRLNGPEVARRLGQLRKDQSATEAIVAAWTRIQATHGEIDTLLQRPNPRAPDINDLLTRVRVNHLVANVHAALARIEESPASARVSSKKGRQRAWQLAEQATASGGHLPEAHLAMGDVLLQSDLGSPAADEYRQAVRLDPASASAHIKLAEALRLQENLPEAIAELREALRIDPKSAVAHTDLGYILEAQQDRTAAIREYREAIALDPDLTDAHNYLAIAMAREGRFPEAVEQFREMIRIDPDSVLGYYNMGIALADMEQDDESAEAFRQAVRVNPNHYNAHFNLGELFRLEGKFDEAVKQFREYLRLAPNTPQTQRNFRRATEFVETHENR